MFKWLRNYRNYRRSGKKFVVDVSDYPKSKYKAFWEIHINAENLAWEVVFYEYGTSNKLLSEIGQAEKDENEARVQSQRFVKKTMKQFKRIR